MSTKNTATRQIMSSIPQLDGWMDYLDTTVGKKPPYAPVAAEALTRVPKQALQVYCKMRGLWTIVTHELVAFLKPHVDGKRAIEICSGRSCLGRALGIQETDSHLVTSDPMVRRSYESMGECTAPFPDGVVIATAAEALSKYKPDVVVGSWVSQLGGLGTPDSSPYGVDEIKLQASVEKYIVIGNRHTHDTKLLIREKAPEIVQLDGLVTRSAYPEENVIYIWGS